VELQNGSATNNSKTDTNLVQVSINLNDVKEDKVLVTITPKITTEDVTYSIPKIVPGTYSIDDYGKYIEEFKAFDSKGIALIVTKTDDNTWNIKNAKSLAKITYLVNDTFDTEKVAVLVKMIFFHQQEPILMLEKTSC
jgi:predicted metalloprotease with PDZ domain